MYVYKIIIFYQQHWRVEVYNVDHVFGTKGCFHGGNDAVDLFLFCPQLWKMSAWWPIYILIKLVLCSNFSPASNGQRTIYKTHTTKVLQENIGFIFLEFHVFKTGTNTKANFSASFGIDMILYTSFIVIQFLQHS